MGVAEAGHAARWRHGTSCLAGPLRPGRWSAPGHTAQRPRSAPGRWC